MDRMSAADEPPVMSPEAIAEEIAAMRYFQLGDMRAVGLFL